jgi:hypothetical protein
MCDIEVIFGDGILGGERLLHILEIKDMCVIVLDHHHLLSDDIAAWPRTFKMGPIKGKFQRFVRLIEISG